ncbi:multiple epidermal growth factor-like domains protein 10 [Haliotis rufescens]|uniref:multiple epidermal growth factor-like domains protein 10 n=1 Tax=Haliotis rufescens TaxID=6454 RepID=UPI001EB0182C|nr:multiple epidermal growth factor-like domains protein 10 [Haliotis rufescens]
MAGMWTLTASVMLSACWIKLVTGTCPLGQFGDSCTYPCHCGDSCDQTTGACGGDCDAGWVGGERTNCQKENVAYRRHAYSPTPLYNTAWSADKVVDGNRAQSVWSGSCFNSADNVWSLWTVDLGQQYRLHDVRIYHPLQNPDRILPIVLYLSNTSTSLGVPCYTFPSDTDVTGNSIYNVTCDDRGRYFTITNTTFLSLCEVEIYVCSPRLYGQNCNQSCHCAEEVCHPVSGVCPGDCRPGWQGDRCDTECEADHYGVNCVNICSDRKCSYVNSLCDRYTGSCDTACLAGWRGVDCTEECNNGTFGQNCSKTCSKRKCEGDSPCDHVIGKCISACVSGWMGEDCNEACDSQHYGPNCIKTCASRHCVGNSSCNSAGHCDCGCETGWTGADCTEGARSVQAAGSNPSQLAVAVVLAFVAGVAVGVIVSAIVWRRRNRRLHKTSRTTNVPNAQTERSQTSDDVGSGIRTYDGLGAVSYDAKMQGGTYSTIKSEKTDLGTGANVLTCDVSDTIGTGTYETLDDTSRGTDGEYSEIGKPK